MLRSLFINCVAIGEKQYFVGRIAKAVKTLGCPMTLSSSAALINDWRSFFDRRLYNILDLLLH